MTPHLDLLLATNRTNPHAFAYISYLAELVYDNPYVTLWISDNSYNLEKQYFLEALEIENLFIQDDKTLGVHSNFNILLEKSTAPYVMALADDDWVHGDSFKLVEAFEDPEVSAAVGPVGLVQAPLRFINYPEDNFMGPDPVERARLYAHNSISEVGLNWLMFGAHRKDTYKLYSEYVTAHPFEFWFRDQMLSQIALLHGKVKGLPHGFTYYQTRTVEELQFKAEADHAKLESETGIKPWIQAYYHFWLACEYATLYRWKKLNVPNREESADKIFQQVFEIFRKEYEKQKPAFEAHFAQEGIHEVMHEVLNKPTAVNGIAGLAAMFLVMNEETGKKFYDFIRTELV